MSSESADRVCGVRFDVADPALPAVVLPPLVRESAPSEDGPPALAVMPPAPGDSTWLLVVGDYCTPHITVLALPGGERVFEATCSQSRDTPREAAGAGSWGPIRGLAADPSGAALVVVGFADVWAGAVAPPGHAAGGAAAAPFSLINSLSRQLHHVFALPANGTGPLSVRRASRTRGLFAYVF